MGGGSGKGGLGDVLPVVVKIPSSFVEQKPSAKQYCYIFTD